MPRGHANLRTPIGQVWPPYTGDREGRTRASGLWDDPNAEDAAKTWIPGLRDTVEVARDPGVCGSCGMKINPLTLECRC